jgi:hypothetical protein
MPRVELMSDETLGGCLALFCAMFGSIAIGVGLVEYLHWNALFISVGVFFLALAVTDA